jgi:hypothetical protein
MDHVLGPAGLHAGDRAHVGHTGFAVLRHLAEQLGEVLLVGGAVAGVARRPDARGAAQRRGFDAGVVGDRGAFRGRGGGAGLAERVVREGGSGLRRQRDFVRQRVELDGAHELLELAQLVLVAGGEDQAHRYAAAALTASC